MMTRMLDRSAHIWEYGGPMISIEDRTDAYSNVVCINTKAVAEGHVITYLATRSRLLRRRNIVIYESWEGETAWNFVAP